MTNRSKPVKDSLQDAQGNDVTYPDFWRAYLRDHRLKSNVYLHCAGTLSALALIAAALWTRSLLMFLGAVLVGYGIAWIGHFFFERNHPTAFQHPLWSLLCDVRLVWLLLSGKLPREYTRHGL